MRSASFALNRGVFPLLVTGLLLSVTGNVSGQSSTVPFTETFTYVHGTTLDGSNGWSVAGSGAAVTDNNRAKVTGEDTVLSNGLGDGRTEVWTDLWVQPVFGAGHDSVTNPPAGSSFAFYVGTNGQVVAFNGTTETQLVHAALTEGEWVRFTVHSKYSTKEWDLYLEGSSLPLATGLAFNSPSAPASFTELGVRGGGATQAYVDNVSITLTQPELEPVGSVFQFK